jgi:hypothetical protein
MGTIKQITMENQSYNDKVFWREDFNNGDAKGGFYFRAVDLVKFFNLVENSEDGGEVVGLRFDKNNVEIIVKVND